MSPAQNALHTPPEGNTNTVSESNPIMFAKLAGRQDIRLKIKQEEGVSGPKVNKCLKVAALFFQLQRKKNNI